MKKEAQPASAALDQSVWPWGDYFVEHLPTKTDIDPRIRPETSLVTKVWVKDNSLSLPRLSQFPNGIDGILKITDPNITYPSFNDSFSKEGGAITMILFAKFFLTDEQEKVYHDFHS